MKTICHTSPSLAGWPAWPCTTGSCWTVSPAPALLLPLGFGEGDAPAWEPQVLASLGLALLRLEWWFTKLQCLTPQVGFTSSFAPFSTQVKTPEPAWALSLEEKNGICISHFHANLLPNEGRQLQHILICKIIAEGFNYNFCCILKSHTRHRHYWPDFPEPWCSRGSRGVLSRGSSAAWFSGNSLERGAVILNGTVCPELNSPAFGSLCR